MGDWKRASNSRKAAIFNAMGIPHDFKIRQSKPRVDHPDLEKHVLRAVSDLLAVHPAVLIAIRQNSGAASYEAKTGKYAPLWFYQWIRSPESMTLPDVWGMLITGRMFFFECKRPSWTKPSDDRERRQALFLDLMRAKGAISAFITDAERANEMLA